MLAIYFLAALALANAAPYYDFAHRRPGFSHRPHHGYGAMNDGFGEGVFDTASFWRGLEDEMHHLDEMLNVVYSRFPTVTSSEKIEGNNYILTLSLIGFDEKDIVVKAREGVVMIQAVHKSEEGSQRSYLDIRTLPTFIDVGGSWTYDKNVLRVTFPVTKKPEEPSVVTTELVTEGPSLTESHSREEIDNHENNNNQDADVGLDRGDTDKGTEVLTNVLPREKEEVEATTYSVDLNNEVEFVPLRY